MKNAITAIAIAISLSICTQAAAQPMTGVTKHGFQTLITLSQNCYIAHEADIGQARQGQQRGASTLQHCTAARDAVEGNQANLGYCERAFDHAALQGSIMFHNANMPKKSKLALDSKKAAELFTKCQEQVRQLPVFQG